ncbi:hypothetical protein Taro_000254, partial [Colocasia esculenta]|nr:hypothetical protein [Colocasia esculenta]
LALVSAPISPLSRFAFSFSLSPDPQFPRYASPSRLCSSYASRHLQGVTSPRSAMAAAACVKSVARSALAAFAPEAPYLAAGTMAGAVDLSFSSSANLEIFNLDLQSEGHELPLAGACPSGERFHRLSWGRPPPSPSEDYALGLVAGGLVDGAVGVWNPIKLISAGSNEVEDALVARLEKHKGAVRGLEFCSLQPNLLASGADEGELCIWDVGKPSEPNLFPTLKPILASTSYNGVTDSRRCTVLQWNPDMSTQLIIAADAGNSSSLRLWDVRRAIAPLKEFVGHTEGVIAMSWCPIDSLYLLTCAKDNRTICWDTVNGEIVRELPPSTSCNFDVHWCPKIPGAIAASSFDVKIGIYNIEACSRPAVLDGNFQTPVTLRAPKWLKCPVGVSFGFGGKLVSFRPSSSPPGASTPTSEVFMHSLVTESSLVSRSTEFEAAIQNGERASLRTLSGDDKETWGFLKVMFEDDGTARTKLLAHLGFSVSNGSEHVADELGSELASNLSLDQNTSEGAAVGKGESSAFDIDNGEDFFNNPVHSSDSLTVEASNAPTANVVQSELEESVESPDSSFDESIRHALIVGDYKGAVAQCISANRMADALVIAHMGGPSLWESTLDRYLSKSNLSYIKVVSAMVKNDLMALVNTRPLDSWKETLALLCT